MLKECIEVFEKELSKKGNKIIIDDYLPDDGTYIIVSIDNDEFKIKECFDIEYNKKTETIQGRENIYFCDICNYDYNSKLIDMNKPMDGKKIIQSNNYLSFFIKKESLSNNKLTYEIIDNYYKVLSNPALKYKKPKAKEIYNLLQNELEEIDQDLLCKISHWIKENIFNLENLNIKIKGKNYLKIFFDVGIEKYVNEGKRYLIPNIYNSNDFNEKVEGIIYGVPNNNMGMNPKKIYLKNKSRKIQVPYLIDNKEVLMQKMFFDYLLNNASKGRVNIYINEEDGIMPFKNGEMPEKDFYGVYMRINKTKELEIQNYDIISEYKFKLRKPFILYNVLEISDKFKGDNYKTYKDRGDMQSILDSILFSKFLVNNYYTKPNEISIKDTSLKRNLILARDKVFNYIYKGNEVGFYKLINNISFDLIKSNILNGYIIKASHQYNLRESIIYYFEGGKNMSDIVCSIKDSLRKSINSKDTGTFKSDSEYYFAVGQFVNYLLSKSKSKNKPHSLANPFINAKNNTIIREKLRNLYKKYNYDIDMNGRRVRNMYAMISSYEPLEKVNQDMIISGYLHSNLIYESNEEERKNG